MTMMINKMNLKFKIVFDASNTNHLEHLRPLHVSCKESEKTCRSKMLRLTGTSSLKLSASKYFLLGESRWSFYIRCLISLYEKFRNFQNCRHFGFLASFKLELVPEVKYYITIAYFLTSWPSYFTFGLAKSHTCGPGQTIHMNQVWWWLATKCDL